ncbi:MAG: hypothetical protein JWN92_995 [Candidatus Acidoferrum typicum]|nr:hypothetical protein [Candidatus Acidoferrum typicum]
MEGVKLWRIILLWFKRGRNYRYRYGSFKYRCAFNSYNGWHIQ